MWPAPVAINLEVVVQLSELAIRNHQGFCHSDEAIRRGGARHHRTALPVAEVAVVPAERAAVMGK